MASRCCGRAPALGCLRAASTLLLLLSLGCLFRGGAAATCGPGPFTCPLGKHSASSLTPCTTCDATDCCKDLLQWSTVSPSPAFPPRWAHCNVAVNGQLLVIAGSTVPSFDAVTGFLNDAWTSTTGTAWALRTPAAGFTPREFHGCVTLGTTAVVIAGYDDFGDLADVWMTTDTGASFTQLTPSTGFSPRNAFGTIIYKNLVWVIGGWSNYTFLNDVWYSSNAASWSQVTTIGTIFSPRDGFGITVFGDKMWIVGGETPTTVLSEVWNTADGASWTNVPQLAGISPRGFGLLLSGTHTGFMFCGGEATVDSTQAYADCWGSLDGATWAALPSLPGPLMGFRAAPVGNKELLLTGGNTGTAVVSTEYALTGAPTCAYTSFTCPLVYTSLSPWTICMGTSCTKEDCCSTSLVASASQYLVIVLSVDCSLYTPTTFALKIAQATGIPVEAIVITYFGCSSLTVYLTVLGSTTALADAALALVAQIALSGVLGPVVTVYFTASPAPAPTPTTTTTTYPTVPFFRPRASSSNPALLGLLALLILPLLCCWLIFLRPRQQCCMAAPVCCAAAPQPMAPYMGGC